MQKTIVAALAFTMMLPVGAFAQTSTTGASASAQVFTRPLKFGDQSDEVKKLQAILKGDVSVYPQGLTTGYFGKLTEDALRRLQARYGLPQTGILDDATRGVLFPANVQITVVSPNGGEVWDRADSHTIAWRSTFGPTVPAAGTPSASGNVPSSILPPNPPAFFRTAVVELIQDSNPNFVYHLGTAELTLSQHVWKIPARIPNGTDYRVRVSFGHRNICIMGLPAESEASTMIFPSPCPMVSGSVWASDTSDNTFTITGSTTTPPDNEVIRKLKEQVSLIEARLSAMVAEIQQIKDILNRF